MGFLQQILVAVFAVFVFSILIAKLVSAAVNGGAGGKPSVSKNSRDFSKIVLKELVTAEELKLKTQRSSGEGKRQSKSKKKVRFAVDHDEPVAVNKVVKFDAVEPSEKAAVVENSCEVGEVCVGVGRIVDDLTGSKGVGLTEKFPELGFGGVQNQPEEVQLFGEFLAQDTASCLLDSHIVEENQLNYPVVVENQLDSPDVEDNRLDSPVVEENQLHYSVVEENQLDASVVEINQIESVAGMVDDYNKTGMELLGDLPTIDDQTEKGNSELIDVKFGECVMNAGEDKKRLKLLCDDNIDEDEKEREGLISDEEDSDDDDWEGVERSDLEKVFAMAANYGMVDDHLQSLESDVQMQLYGLHKVAMEGPCHEAQPMALKVSARAKWNAWQRLGNMNPDEAMEQYINLLSEKVPGWSQRILSFGVNSSEPITTSILTISQKERNKEIESGSDGNDLTGISDSINEDKR